MQIIIAVVLLDTSVSDAGLVMSWSLLQILIHSALDTFSTLASPPVSFSATAVTKRMAAREPDRAKHRESQ